MTLPLFVYGTLRDPDLLAAVLGRQLRSGGQHVARAPGFRAVHYPGRVYPALIRVPGAAAEGLLLIDLSPFERDLLDAFEGEEYRRTPIATMVEEDLFEADAYLPRQQGRERRRGLVAGALAGRAQVAGTARRGGERRRDPHAADRGAAELAGSAGVSRLDSARVSHDKAARIACCCCGAHFWFGSTAVRGRR